MYLLASEATVKRDEAAREIFVHMFKREPSEADLNSFIQAIRNRDTPDSFGFDQPKLQDPEAYMKAARKTGNTLPDKVEKTSTWGNDESGAPVEKFETKPVPGEDLPSVYDGDAAYDIGLMLAPALLTVVMAWIVIRPR